MIYIVHKLILGGYQQEGKSKFYNDETENIPDEEREGASRIVLDIYYSLNQGFIQKETKKSLREACKKKTEYFMTTS